MINRMGVADQETHGLRRNDDIVGSGARQLAVLAGRTPRAPANCGEAEPPPPTYGELFDFPWSQNVQISTDKTDALFFHLTVGQEPRQHGARIGQSS